MALILALAACGGGGGERAGAGPADAPGQRMTADEVRAAFVGQPWKGPNGIYSMEPDGTYSYRSTDTTIEWGPFRYSIEPDGTVTGPSGTWTFYRIGSAYRYYSSATNEFYLAVPVNE